MLLGFGLKRRNDRHKSWPPIVEHSLTAKRIAATISLLLVAMLAVAFLFTQWTFHPARVPRVWLKKQLMKQHAVSNAVMPWP